MNSKLNNKNHSYDFNIEPPLLKDSIGKSMGICKSCEVKGKTFPEGKALDMVFYFGVEIIYYNCYYCKEPNEFVALYSYGPHTEHPNPGPDKGGEIDDN